MLGIIIFINAVTAILCDHLLTKTVAVIVLILSSAWYGSRDY